MLARRCGSRFLAFLNPLSRTYATMQSPFQAQAFTCGDVVTYQLLCGRDIAQPSRAAPHEKELFSIAQQMANFVYLVVNMRDRTALAVDAAWDVKGLYDVAAALGVTLQGAVYTHSHFDHCGGKVPSSGGRDTMMPGAQDVVARGGRLWVGHADAAQVQKNCQVPASAMTTLQDGDVVASGGLLLHTLHTPGHSPGSLCLLVSPKTVGSRPPSAPVAGREVPSPAGVLITGDTLFVGSCGRTDLAGSDQRDMLRSLSRLSTLTPGTCVLPGHNYGPVAASTVAQERASNPMIAAGLRAAPQPPALPPWCAQGPPVGPLGLTPGQRVLITAGAGEGLRGKVGVLRGFSAATGLYDLLVPQSAGSPALALPPAVLQPLSPAS